MPLIRIDIRKGKSPEYKRKLLQIVHEALVDAFRIPDGDRTQRLYELDDEHFELSDGKTADCVVIELTVFPGRSLGAKKQLYKLLTDRLGVELGIAPRDVTIVLLEPTMENWSIAGQPASEVDLGFKIDV